MVDRLFEHVLRCFAFMKMYDGRFQKLIPLIVWISRLYWETFFYWTRVNSSKKNVLWIDGCSFRPCMHACQGGTIPPQFFSFFDQKEPPGYTIWWLQHTALCLKWLKCRSIQCKLVQSWSRLWSNIVLWHAWFGACVWAPYLTILQMLGGLCVRNELHSYKVL